MRIATLFLPAVLSLSAGLSAQILATDSFSYTGALTSNGWTGHSSPGTKLIQSNGTFATLDQSTGAGEDVSLVFPALSATDAVYAAFVFTVPSGNPVNPDGQGLYFAHFKDSGTSFRARTGVLSPAAAGDFQLAIHADNADLGAGIAWPGDLAFDTPYQVVISWEAATGTSKLWLNPRNCLSPSVTHTGTFVGTLITGFALRQSNDYTGFIQVDEVVVGRSFPDVFGGSGSFSVSTLGCGAATLSASGSPNLGGLVHFDIANYVGASQAIFIGLTNLGGGFPICAACTLGTDLTVVLSGANTSLPVPCEPLIVGAIFYTQGIDVSGAPGGCDLGGLTITLTDTIRTVLGM